MLPSMSPGVGGGPIHVHLGLVALHIRLLRFGVTMTFGSSGPPGVHPYIWSMSFQLTMAGGRFFFFTRVAEPPPPGKLMSPVAVAITENRVGTGKVPRIPEHSLAAQPSSSSCCLGKVTARNPGKVPFYSGGVGTLESSGKRGFFWPSRNSGPP